jgi:hypothetical protein
MTSRRTILAIAASQPAWRVAALAADDFPAAEISNGQIRAKAYLPDVNKGFYRPARFDWSGHILGLQYKGHELVHTMQFSLRGE